jgi:hypothetical protein
MKDLLEFKENQIYALQKRVAILEIHTRAL